MKLLKKLAILTCALAAFSFVACDPSTGSTGSVEPNEPVVDAGGEEPSKATITVAVTADESQVAGFGEAVYAYLYNTSAPDNGEVFGGWPGKELAKNNELGIWSVTGDVPSDSISYSVIFNNNNGEQFDAPAITVNESKLYTRAHTWIDWDGTSADTTEPYVEPEPPAVPTEMSSAIIALAVDVSNLGWEEGAPYIWGWGGAWGVNDAPTSPLFGKEFGIDALKLTQLEGTNIYYFTFSKDYATENGPHVVFISSEKLDNESDRIAADLTALEAGKGYLLKADGGEWTTFTTFAELKSE